MKLNANPPAPPVAQALMNPNVSFVTPELSLRELVDFFLTRNLSCAPVVGTGEQDQRLLGFVSQGDALAQLSQQMFEGFPRAELTVAHVMKRHPIAIDPTTDVFAIASIFISHGFRHVPVVDSQSRLVGIVSRREVLEALVQYYDQDQHAQDRQHFRPDLHQIINHRFIVSNR